MTHYIKHQPQNHAGARMLNVLTLLFLLLLTGCGLQMGYPEFGAATQEKKDTSGDGLRIFVSETTSSGKIGTSGIGSADAICAADKNKPSTGTYRAMIVDDQSRIAKIGEQADWVLKANRKYIRPDKTVIGTTTKDSVFEFPLNAPISTSAALVLVGIGPALWSTGNHCSRWSSNLGSGTVNLGQAASTLINSVLGASDTCDTAYRLYCVEQ